MLEIDFWDDYSLTHQNDASCTALLDQLDTVPIIIVVARRFAQTQPRSNVTAVLGLLIVNISFFYLPWLDLSPIKGSL